jgi:hypothetical protein
LGLGGGTKFDAVTGGRIFSPGALTGICAALRWPWEGAIFGLMAQPTVTEAAAKRTSK